MSGARPSASRASQQRRARIVDATRDILRRSSADKVLVADIAAEADVSVATVYNLVGQRDRVLVAVLDQTAAHVRERVATGAGHRGIDGCVAALSASCEAILSDPVAHRHVLAALGELSDGVWLDEGILELIDRGVREAVDDGEIGQHVAVDRVASAVQIGFRGALMSWVFGQLTDVALRESVEVGALLTLAAVAHDEHRPRLLERADAIGRPGAGRS